LKPKADRTVLAFAERHTRGSTSKPGEELRIVLFAGLEAIDGCDEILAGWQVSYFKATPSIGPCARNEAARRCP
jgi:hypothetical protein